MAEANPLLLTHVALHEPPGRKQLQSTREQLQFSTFYHARRKETSSVELRRLQVHAEGGLHGWLFACYVAKHGMSMLSTASAQSCVFWQERMAAVRALFSSHAPAQPPPTGNTSGPSSTVASELQRRSSERDAARRERDVLRRERDEARHERDGARHECNDVRQERDDARQECNELLRERDDARQQLDTARQQLDTAQQECDVLLGERDSARQQRNEAQAGLQECIDAGEAVAAHLKHQAELIDKIIVGVPGADFARRERLANFDRTRLDSEVGVNDFVGTINPIWDMAPELYPLLCWMYPEKDEGGTEDFLDLYPECMDGVRAMLDTPLLLIHLLSLLLVQYANERDQEQAARAREREQEQAERAQEHAARAQEQAAHAAQAEELQALRRSLADESPRKKKKKAAE